MEELTQLYFQAHLCSLFHHSPANSVLKTDIDTKPPETHTRAYWSYWGLLVLLGLVASPFAHYHVQCFDFDLQHIQKPYFLLFFTVPLIPCPSSRSYVRFRPTTQVSYKTNIISSLILGTCV